MTLQTMTLNLPRPLYNRLKQRAEQTRRTVEAELLEVARSVCGQRKTCRPIWLRLYPPFVSWTMPRFGAPQGVVCQRRSLSR